MTSFQLWAPGEILKEVHDIEPRLASWDSNTHPAQVRLRAYLDDLMARIIPIPSLSDELFLHLDVDVQRPERLLRHHDLENYLTPLFGQRRLDPARFKLVSGTKRVGGGSRLTIGKVQPLEVDLAQEGWQSYACAAGSGTQTTRWKANLREQLAASNPHPLPPGPVEVQLAWCCSPNRNWVMLWKATGDAMGPVIGVDNPGRPFSPRDDRITCLALHVIFDRHVGHDVDVGMWWRPG